jgi:hypothetical protein
VRVETGEGRITTSEVERQPDRDEVRRTKLHAGGGTTLDTVTVRRPDGTVQRTEPDGTINRVDPGGDSSITAGGYFGWGGTVTVGWTPGGGFFASLRGGVGLGFEATFDPTGVPPGYGCDNPQAGGAGLGVFGEVGVGAGPVGLSATKNSGGLLFSPTPTRSRRTGSFNTTNVSPVFSPQRFQAKWGAAAGAQLDFFTNDPKCKCPN